MPFEQFVLLIRRGRRRDERLSQPPHHTGPGPFRTHPPSSNKLLLNRGKPDINGSAFSAPPHVRFSSFVLIQIKKLKIIIVRPGGPSSCISRFCGTGPSLVFKALPFQTFSCFSGPLRPFQLSQPDSLFHTCILASHRFLRIALNRTALVGTSPLRIALSGSARLGAPSLRIALAGSARLGAPSLRIALHGSARFCIPSLRIALHGSARLGAPSLRITLRGSARLGIPSLGITLRGSARLGASSLRIALGHAALV